MKFRGMLGNWSCGRMTETPEDIATLYSHARMHWARYWDFSASRKQVRQQLGIMRPPLEWPATSLPVAELPSHAPLSQPEDLASPVHLQEDTIEVSEPQPQPASQIPTAEM